MEIQGGIYDLASGHVEFLGCSPDQEELLSSKMPLPLSVTARSSNVTIMQWKVVSLKIVAEERRHMTPELRVAAMMNRSSTWVRNIWSLDCNAWRRWSHKKTRSRGIAPRSGHPATTPASGSAIARPSPKTATWLGQWPLHARWVGFQSNRLPRVLQSRMLWSNVSQEQLLTTRKHVTYLTWMESYVLGNAAAPNSMTLRWLGAATAKSLTVEHKIAVRVESTTQKPLAAAKAACLRRSPGGVVATKSCSIATHMDAVWRMGHRFFVSGHRTAVRPQKERVEFLLE